MLPTTFPIAMAPKSNTAQTTHSTTNHTVSLLRVARSVVIGGDMELDVMEADFFENGSFCKPLSNAAPANGQQSNNCTSRSTARAISSDSCQLPAVLISRKAARTVGPGSCHVSAARR